MTTTDRGWSNHVRLTGPTGLDRESFAMTEQPRSISRGRLTGVAGSIDRACRDEIDRFLAEFLGLPSADGFGRPGA